MRTKEQKIFDNHYRRTVYKRITSRRDVDKLTMWTNRFGYGGFIDNGGKLKAYFIEAPNDLIFEEFIRQLTYDHKSSAFICDINPEPRKISKKNRNKVSQLLFRFDPGFNDMGQEQIGNVNADVINQRERRIRAVLDVIDYSVLASQVVIGWYRSRSAELYIPKTKKLVPMKESQVLQWEKRDPCFDIGSSQDIYNLPVDKR